MSPDLSPEARAAMGRSDLARAKGLAEALVGARPCMPEMDGVRDVAAEIVTLLAKVEPALALEPTEAGRALDRIDALALDIQQEGATLRPGEDQLVEARIRRIREIVAAARQVGGTDG